jgi:hypothetical protein
METLSLKKLNEVAGEEQYRIEITNRFAALKNLQAEVDINRTWETIRESEYFSQRESRLS